MDILDIIIVFLIAIIIWFVLFNKQSYDTEQFKPNKMLVEIDTDDKLYDDKNALDMESIVKYVDIITKSKSKHNINPYFEEMQFHTDYRDTLNAFNLIVPNQKQLFNRSDLPLTNTCSPPISEVNKLIANFIREINKMIKNHVSDELNMQNGWQDDMPQKKFNDGFGNEMLELGLPQSIYIEPRPKAFIKLIKVDHTEKYETSDEIRYVVFLIIQKKNTKDQMVVKVSFVIDRSDLNLEREFFSKDKNNYETVVKIEEISVIGFLTNNSFGTKSSRDKYYNFDKIDDGKMFRDDDIIHMLNDKKKKYAAECHR